MDGNYFRGTPARSALTWVIVSQNSSSTFSRDKPTTSTLGTPASSRRTSLASGRASPVHHSWRGVRSRRTVRRRGCVAAHHGACWPGRAPTTPPASTGRRRLPAGHRFAIPRRERVGRRSTVVVPGKLVGRVRVEVDPLDAVGVAAAHRDHVHRRHRRLPYPLAAGPQVSHPARDRCRTNRWSPPATGVAQPWSPPCRAESQGNNFRQIDIISVSFHHCAPQDDIG